jgi:hypothetical protein
LLLSANTERRNLLMARYCADTEPEMENDDDDRKMLFLIDKLDRKFAALERLSAAPPPMQAVRESLELVEHMLKVQCLMRKAYPKRSRLARRNRRRSGRT